MEETKNKIDEFCDFLKDNPSVLKDFGKLCRGQEKLGQEGQAKT